MFGILKNNSIFIPQYPNYEKPKTQTRLSYNFYTAFSPHRR